jgi:hypothetical protein
MQAGKMVAYVAGSGRSYWDFSGSGPLAVGKHILNALSQRALAASERSRFATLPSRYLDDVGMTEGERAYVVGYDEPMVDGWRVVASHL